MDNIKKFEDFLDRMQRLLDEAKKQGHIIVRVEDLENAFPELAESEDEKMMNQLHSWMKEFGGAEEYAEKVHNWLKGLLERQKSCEPFSNGEDERVRKSLTAYFAKFKQSDMWDDDFSFGDIVSWLEKQGEYANFRNKIQVGDKVTRSEDGVLVNLSQLKRVAKKDEKQGVQKPVDVRTIGYWHVEDVEQKPTAWSEEDIIHLNKCISYMSRLDSSEMDWLKSLKDRVQPKPKQEWGEEDEEHIESILKRLDGMCKKGATFTKTYFAVNQDMDWLKSLKPQNRWKPSDEQIKALEHFVRSICESGYDDNTKLLYSLLSDLKKLK